MKARAEQSFVPGSAYTPSTSAPQDGCWEIFLVDYELPVVLPLTVPEARVRHLCEALGVPYRHRPRVD